MLSSYLESFRKLVGAKSSDEKDIQHKLEVFNSLIINIQWYEQRNRDYHNGALDVWKKKNDWKVLDENLEFNDLAKIMRRCIEEHDIQVDLSTFKMRRLPNWYDDMYGSDNEEDEGNV